MELTKSEIILNFGVNKMHKHAYLIIAHHNIEQLKLLLLAIDNNRTDIYIIFDKKSKLDCNSKKKYLIKDLKYSRVWFIDSIKIYWGDYSLIDAEIKLFEKAYLEGKGKYSYYHLISGDNLPLTNQTDILKFFDEHPNMLFLSYGRITNRKLLERRIKYWHISPRLIGKYGNKVSPINLLFRLIDNLFVMGQRFLGINKIKRFNLKVDYASEWLTLNKEFVWQMLKNKDWIEKVFKHSIACDELFIPILINKLGFNNFVYNSSRQDNNPNSFQGSLDYINWWDGSPYIWQDRDIKKIEHIKSLGYLFSRKFDLNNTPKLKEWFIENIIY
ncbi:glycosyl transferase [Limosilactobacillus reuteri]|nr:glycosyl transferase [Limosilactobacillus reuteri]PUH32977.1 glycosyl transferase [Limosilactobacillus reuteri]PUH33362.1 glycosyl transferase [Limosilactobacillus reuteri]